MEREAQPQKSPQAPPYRAGLRILARLIVDEILKDRHMASEGGSSKDPTRDAATTPQRRRTPSPDEPGSVGGGDERS